MPLMKRKKDNKIESEKESVKPSLAVAFDVRKRNSKPKHYDNGGNVQTSPTSKPQKSQFDKNGEEISKGVRPGSLSESFANLKSGLGFAEGGEVCSHCEGRGHMMQPDMDEHNDSPIEPIEEHKHRSMVEAIMSKMNFKRLAEGGEVTEDEEEGPGERREQNIDAEDFEAGHDSQFKPEAEDSAEHSDEEEEDSENKHDMVSAIRKKMKMGMR